MTSRDNTLHFGRFASGMKSRHIVPIVARSAAFSPALLALIWLS